ncbi:hypothetical protein FPOA_06508 [Fusarium poae]|uniref:GATA-type domain-containing protein n=1 Tax=Fusarium poae TaxID=36050 RepID=A0A1B8AZX0_FUSPO|nr:hypothetical protein FPOA_06508 [Fusarium poae]
MEPPVFFTQPHSRLGSQACRHGCRFESQQEAGFMLSQKPSCSPLPHSVNNLPEQYDMQDLEGIGIPLYEVALFQTSSISSSLAEPPLKTRRKKTTHVSPTREASIGTYLARDKLCRSLRAHGTGGIHGLESKLYQKRPALDESPHCHICKTTDTPRWRTGPFGPYSFCNVCGLMYDKRRSRLDTTYQSG